MLEFEKLVLEISSGPEEHLIEILSAYRANQSLHEGMDHIADYTAC
jgi:hypothetical protein